MALTVAVQMDPIQAIRIAGDTTFALLLEAQARGHRLLYYTPDRLSLQGRRVTARVEPLTVRDVEGAHATLGEIERIDLTEADVVLMRQDPPFDMAYVTATHMLERIHPQTLVVNNPAEVRNAPEKLFVLDFPELMPPTLISRDRAEIEAFRLEHGTVAMKPLHGHGGAAVFKVTEKDPNFGSMFDLFATTFKEAWVTQRYLDRVTEGDKRIILVDGVAMGAVNRVPATNDLRSNMVRGGAAAPPVASSFMVPFPPRAPRPVPGDRRQVIGWSMWSRKPAWPRSRSYHARSAGSSGRRIGSANQRWT